MSRRSRKKATPRAEEVTPEPVPDGKFALSMALAMRMSQAGSGAGNAVAQNRNERLEALTGTGDRRAKD